jgi:hypothetical protein
MLQVANWNCRKIEIATAFRQAASLPAEADPEFYGELLTQIGVCNNQDMNIRVSFMNDIIMAARREERPVTPLETFLDWLRCKQTNEE